MARELPIRNGRLTTDLDADGHKIKNLPPGEGFTQEQADWGETDATKPSFIKRKPTIPAPVTIDSALSATSENPVQNKAVKAAVDAKCTLQQAVAEATRVAWDWSGVSGYVQVPGPLSGPIEDGDGTIDGKIPFYVDSEPFYESIDGHWYATVLTYADGGNGEWEGTTVDLVSDGPDDAESINLFSDYWDVPVPFGVVRIRNVNGLARLADVPDVGGKANKSEMSVTPGTGADADKTTIQLKSGTGATVLTAHQSLAGLTPRYAFSAVQTVSGAGTEQSPNEVALADAQNKRVAVTAAGAYVSVAAPATASDGIVRDMMLTLDCSTLSEGDEPHVTFASVYKGADGDANNLVADAGAVNVYYVTEYAPNAFLVAKQAIGVGT